MESLFNDAEVVSRYTDSQAVDDGILVALKDGHRVTSNVWEWMASVADGREKPPDRWPVSLLLWFSGHQLLAMAVGLIEVNAANARRIYENNIDGGIWTEDHEGRTLWLIPNECGGLTLMFPEDY